MIFFLDLWTLVRCRPFSTRGRVKRDEQIRNQHRPAARWATLTFTAFYSTWTCLWNPFPPLLIHGKAKVYLSAALGGDGLATQKLSFFWNDGCTDNLQGSLQTKYLCVHRSQMIFSEIGAARASDFLMQFAATLEIYTQNSFFWLPSQ